jgi:GTPase SAR1 family protein
MSTKGPTSVASAMHESPVDWAEVRSAILRDLDVISQLAKEQEDSRSLQEAREIATKIAENRFLLAVLGQFKRGKTSLINSLLGSEVLPVAVVPLTSIITILSYGESAAATVHFLAGEARDIALDDLPQYVTERHNPENAKRVRHVEVRYPSAYLRDGILLVDTPGVGSTYEHNTEVTHSFLARVDAAIFLVSVDPPLTAVEAEFLRRARQEVHRFFFVLNKIDLMSEAEMQESLVFTRQQIERQAEVSGIELFPLSARQGLQAKKHADWQALALSRLPAFEHALRAFLMKEKGAVLLESWLSDVLRLAGDLRFAIELESQAAAVPLEQLTEKQHLLEAELKKIEQERKDMNVLLCDEVARLITEVEGDLQRRVEDSIPAVQQRLQEFYARNPAGRGRLVKLLDDFMNEQVEWVFNEWRIEEDRKMDATFTAVSSRFTEKTNAIIRNIRELTSRIFDIAVQTFESPAALRSDTYLYYKVDPLFYFTIDKIPFVLPRFLFRSYVLARMRDKIHLELRRNAGRIRYDYLRRIENSIEQLRKELNLKIDATLGGTRQAVERARLAHRSSSAEYARSVEAYRRCSRELQVVMEHCQELLHQVYG